MPVLDPTLSLSSRQEAFCNHYHDKTRVNMTFRDTPQQPVQPASSRTARSSLPRTPIRGRSGTSGGPASFRLERSGRDRTGRRPAPAEDTYDSEQFPGEWADGDRPSEEERAGGVETDWLYQRRNDYAELHDPWPPENIERRQADSLNRLERAGPFNLPAPDHDIS